MDFCVEAAAGYERESICRCVPCAGRLVETAKQDLRKRPAAVVLAGKNGAERISQHIDRAVVLIGAGVVSVRSTQVSFDSQEAGETLGERCIPSVRIHSGENGIVLFEACEVCELISTEDLGLEITLPEQRTAKAEQI